MDLARLRERLLARWRRLAAERPTLLCWPRACPYYLRGAAVRRWYGVDQLGHREFHALERYWCGTCRRGLIESLQQRERRASGPDRTGPAGGTGASSPPARSGD